MVLNAIIQVYGAKMREICVVGNDFGQWGLPLNTLSSKHGSTQNMDASPLEFQSESMRYCAIEAITNLVHFTSYAL